jgi:hypothetical protein
MLGYIATTTPAEVSGGPTIDPVTYAHPSKALGEAQRLGAEALAAAVHDDAPTLTRGLLRVPIACGSSGRCTTAPAAARRSRRCSRC